MICVSGNLVFAQRIMFSGCFDLSGNLEIFIARKDISHDMRVLSLNMFLSVLLTPGLCIAEKQLMIQIAELVPKHHGRTKKQEPVAGPSVTTTNKKNKKKK